MEKCDNKMSKNNSLCVCFIAGLEISVCVFNSWIRDNTRCVFYTWIRDNTLCVFYSWIRDNTLID